MSETQAHIDTIARIAEDAAESAVNKFVDAHPEVRRGTVVAEIPAPLKWAAVITAAIISMAASGGVVWLVSSVSQMSVTLARMDERMGNYITSQENRIREIERRVDRLERHDRKEDSDAG